MSPVRAEGGGEMNAPSEHLGSGGQRRQDRSGEQPEFASSGEGGEALLNLRMAGSRKFHDLAAKPGAESMNLAVLTLACPSFRASDHFGVGFHRAAHGAAARRVWCGTFWVYELLRLAFASTLALAFACFAASAARAISRPSHCRIGAAADFRSQTIRFMRPQKHFSSRALVNHIDTGQVSHAGEGSGRSFSSSAAKTGLQ